MFTALAVAVAAAVAFVIPATYSVAPTFSSLCGSGVSAFCFNESLCISNVSGPSCSVSCYQGVTNFPSCDTLCDSGLWGLGCNNTCNCLNGAACDPVNGRCTYGCPCGWAGNACNQQVACVSSSSEPTSTGTTPETTTSTSNPTSSSTSGSTSDSTSDSTSGSTSSTNSSTSGSTAESTPTTSDSSSASISSPGTNTSVSSTPSSTTTTSAIVTTTTSQGLSSATVGLIVGLVVAGVIVLALLFLLIFCCCRARSVEKSIELFVGGDPAIAGSASAVSLLQIYNDYQVLNFEPRPDKVAIQAGSNFALLAQIDGSAMTAAISDAIKWNNFVFAKSSNESVLPERNPTNALAKYRNAALMTDVEQIQRIELPLALSEGPYKWNAVDNSSASFVYRFDYFISPKLEVVADFVDVLPTCEDITPDYIVSDIPKTIAARASFWKLVAEHEVGYIVLFAESAALKAPYWPTKVGEVLPLSLQYGEPSVDVPLQVILLHEWSGGMFTIRQFSVTKGHEKPHQVTQYQFSVEKWPSRRTTNVYDVSAMQDELEYILQREELLHSIAEFYVRFHIHHHIDLHQRKLQSRTPSRVLVQDNNASSRCAVFLMLDQLDAILLEEHTAETVWNMQQFVRYLHVHRASLVERDSYQQLTQQLFVYLLAFYKSRAYPGMIDRVLSELRSNTVDEASKISIQYETIEDFSLRWNANDSIASLICENARRPINQDRLRNRDVLAADWCRFRGTSPEQPFINAVLLPSINIRTEFVVTETPNRLTCDAFWTMVTAHQVPVVVCLDTEDIPNRDDLLYYPSVAQPKVDWTDKFTVSCLHEAQDFGGLVTLRVLLIERAEQRSNTDNSMLVQVSLNRDWPIDRSEPNDAAGAILALYKHVCAYRRRAVAEAGQQLESFVRVVTECCAEDSAKRPEVGPDLAPAPVVVHCADGVTRCGLVATVFQLLDSLDSQSLNPFAAVQTVVHCNRLRLPQLISSQQQYECLWDCLQRYEKTFDIRWFQPLEPVHRPRSLISSKIEFENSTTDEEVPNLVRPGMRRRVQLYDLVPTYK